MEIELQDITRNGHVNCMRLGTAHSICLGHAVAVTLNGPSLDHYHHELVLK